MDGLGWLPSTFCQAFGSPSRRRCQEDLASRLFHHRKDPLDDRGLPGAGTAGEHKDPVIHGSFHSFCLFWRQMDPFVLFPFLDDLLVIHLPQGIHIIPESQQPMGNPLFCPVQVFRVHAHMVSPVFRPEKIVLQDLLEHLFYFQGIHLEDFGCHTHQPPVRHTGMALAGSLEQGIVDPCPDPVFIMLIHPQIPGQGICGTETDAVHFFCQAIGVVADPGHRRIAVKGLDPGGIIPADAVALQEKDQFPIVFQLSIRSHDGFCLFLPDAVDFPQPFRRLLQDLQGLFPELVHDPLGHGRTHALQDAAAQHLHQAFCALRLDSFPALGLELPPKPGMVPPLSHKAHLFSGKRSPPLIDNGNRPHFRIFSPEHTEGPFCSLKYDILYGEFNRYWSGHAPWFLLNICFTYYSTVFRFF